MENLNRIGLDINKSEDLANKLDDLLSNYSVFYQNTRGYHWNVSGNNFFELHIKFEELYNDLFIKIDEVAERILTLGHKPTHKFTDYLTKTKIKESNEGANGLKAVEEIVVAFQTIITQQREILIFSGEMGDEATNAQMSDYIREQEKLIWMYSAYLNN